MTTRATNQGDGIMERATPHGNCAAVVAAWLAATINARKLWATIEHLPTAVAGRGDVAMADASADRKKYKAINVDQ